MNEKGTNFCSFPVGLEPATPAHEAVTQSIRPPRGPPRWRNRLRVLKYFLYSVIACVIWVQSCGFRRKSFVHIFIVTYP